MKRLLFLALILAICGCGTFSKKADVPESSDIAEVPEEAWKRVQQKIEERKKAAAPKKEEQPGVGQEKDRPQMPDPGRALDASPKRK